MKESLLMSESAAATAATFVPPVVPWEEHIAAVQAFLKDGDIDWESFRFGEALFGDGNEIAHPTVIMSAVSGPVGYAACKAFAMPQKGHTPLIAVRSPNVRVPIFTVVANEVTIGNLDQAILAFGPLQRAAADAVTHCVQAGILPQDAGEQSELAIIFQGFIHPAGKDVAKIYWFNYVAMVLCIVRAVTRSPGADEIIGSSVGHPYCDCPTAQLPDGVSVKKPAADASE